MPISYHVEEESRMIVTIASGVVTDDEILEHAGIVTTDPRVPEDALSLVDVRDVKEAEVSAVGLRKMVEIFRAHDYAPKTAFIANSDVVFGMARMFELLLSDSPTGVRVFRDLEEGRRWLGLGETD